MLGYGRTRITIPTGGAEVTTHDQFRLYSNLACCTGLLIHDVEADKTYGFHFFNGCVNDEQRTMLEAMKQTGHTYRGRFLYSTSMNMTLPDAATTANRNTPIRAVINAYLPHITWVQKDICTGEPDGWQFEYNNRSRELTLTSGSKEINILDPLDTKELSTWVQTRRDARITTSIHNGRGV